MNWQVNGYVWSFSVYRPHPTSYSDLIRLWLRAYESTAWFSNIHPRLPVRVPACKPSAVALAAVPGRMDFAVACDQHDDVQPLGTPQRFDRLLRSLGNGTRDIEGRVDGQLDANMAAERLQVCIGEGVVFGAHDLD